MGWPGPGLGPIRSLDHLARPRRGFLSGRKSIRSQTNIPMTKKVVPKFGPTMLNLEAVWRSVASSIQVAHVCPVVVGLGWLSPESGAHQPSVQRSTYLRKLSAASQTRRGRAGGRAAAGSQRKHPRRSPPRGGGRVLFPDGAATVR